MDALQTALATLNEQLQNAKTPEEAAEIRGKKSLLLAGANPYGVKEYLARKEGKFVDEVGDPDGSSADRYKWAVKNNNFFGVGDPNASFTIGRERDYGQDEPGVALREFQRGPQGAYSGVAPPGRGDQRLRDGVYPDSNRVTLANPAATATAIDNPFAAQIAALQSAGAPQARGYSAAQAQDRFAGSDAELRAIGARRAGIKRPGYEFGNTEAELEKLYAANKRPGESAGDLTDQQRNNALIAAGFKGLARASKGGRLMDVVGDVGNAMVPEIQATRDKNIKAAQEAHIEALKRGEQKIAAKGMDRSERNQQSEKAYNYDRQDVADSLDILAKGLDIKGKQTTVDLANVKEKNEARKYSAVAANHNAEWRQKVSMMIGELKGKEKMVEQSLNRAGFSLTDAGVKAGYKPTTIEITAQHAAALLGKAPPDTETKASDVKSLGESSYATYLQEKLGYPPAIPEIQAFASGRARVGTDKSGKPVLVRD